jgi:uncharacterized membrane protein (DUF373 family)
LATAFSQAEDVIYVGLALLLICVAAGLLINEIVFLSRHLWTGNFSDTAVTLLDRILLIIIFAELLYTVQISFVQHTLQAGPFLVVGLIAVTRRILVLIAELPKLVKEDVATFQYGMIELGLLTVLVVALVICLYFIHPTNPGAAAHDGVPNKK